MPSKVKPEIVVTLSRSVRDPETNGTFDRPAGDEDVPVLGQLLEVVPDDLRDLLLDDAESVTITLRKVTEAEMWVRAK